MVFSLDVSTEFGRRVGRHLEHDPVVWLTTVSASGTPQPSPVWFLWDGAEGVTVHSLPDSSRSRNLAARPRVSLNFAGDGRGGDIVVLTGTARLDSTGASADRMPDYLAKYADHIQRIGHTPGSFAAQYSLPVRIALTSLRGH
jgi:PPOX class probable F420-dependent enzyme